MEQFKLITQLAKDKENTQPPIGLLTTEDRHTWAKLRNLMLKSECTYYCICLTISQKKKKIFFIFQWRLAITFADREDIWTHVKLIIMKICNRLTNVF